MTIGRYTPLAMFIVALTLVGIGYTQSGEMVGTMSLLAGALMALGGAFATISRRQTRERGEANKSTAADDLVDPTKGE